MDCIQQLSYTSFESNLSATLPSTLLLNKILKPFFPSFVPPVKVMYALFDGVRTGISSSCDPHTDFSISPAIQQCVCVLRAHGMSKWIMVRKIQLALHIYKFKIHSFKGGSGKVPRVQLSWASGQRFNPQLQCLWEREAMSSQDRPNISHYKPLACTTMGGAAQEVPKQPMGKIATPLHFSPPKKIHGVTCGY